MRSSSFYILMSVIFPLNIKFNEGIILIKCELPKREFYHNDTVYIDWYWKCERRIGDSAKLWVRIINYWDKEMAGPDACMKPLSGSQKIQTSQSKFIITKEFIKGKYGIVILGGFLFIGRSFFFFTFPHEKFILYKKNKRVIGTFIVK